MKFYPALFYTILCACAAVKGETKNDSASGAVRKAKLIKGFSVTGQTGTARTTTVPGFVVAGHTGTSSPFEKQQTAHKKLLIIENRPLPAPSERQNLTYMNDIRPIFQTNCFSCHGENNQMGGLRLDTLESILKGTKNNKVIVPGKSRQSSLVTAIALLDDDSAMPPGNRTPLTSKQIGLIRAWIIQGAK
jgi:hypothetical protein